MPESYLKARKQRIEHILDRTLPSIPDDPEKDPHQLYSAMRYTTLGEAKRTRPLLLYATGEAFQVSLTQLDPLACAIELIHSYSLVHDDLPSMDNDDVRRGKPSCHKAYPEATAILVGDALQNLAFSVLTQPTIPCTPAQTQIAIIRQLAEASGIEGMILGQAMDLDYRDHHLPHTESSLDKLHQHKTGALIQASITLPLMLLPPNTDPHHTLSLLTYAQHLGLMFQIQDDLLDAPMDNNDATDEPNYVRLLGIPKAQEKIRTLYEEACNQLRCLATDRATNLLMLTQLLFHRTQHYD